MDPAEVIYEEHRKLVPGKRYNTSQALEKIHKAPMLTFDCPRCGKNIKDLK